MNIESNRRFVLCDFCGLKFKRCLFASLQAIRDGMVWLIPCLMLSSFSLFFASIGEFAVGNRTTWIEQLYSLHSAIADFFPYLMTAAISYVLAMQWRLPRPPVMLLVVVFLLTISQILPSGVMLRTFQIVIAISTPIYAVPMLAKLLQIDAIKLTSTDSAGRIVKESLNFIIPSILTFIVVLLVNYAVFGVIQSIHLIEDIRIDYANQPTMFGVVFAALNSVIWFLGMHGYYALLPMVDLLQEASNLNQATILVGGQVIYDMNLSFMGAFVFLGGSGATFSLVLALLWFSDQRSLRLLALASIPIGLLNINEILLFGLPIILNPRLFWPFLFAPIANVLTSMSAVSLGLVPSPSVSVPFNSPLLLNAWMATDGAFAAVLLQVINIGIGIAIYFPSVRALNTNASKTDIHLSAFDTTYSRRKEEAEMLTDDPIARAQVKEKDNLLVEKQLVIIGQRDFCLEYQPQVCPNSGKTVGCEALIRSIDSNGSVKYPGTFLPWLEKAKLMKDVDLWVFKQVIKDLDKMQQQGVFVPVSINVSPDTLMDSEYLAKIEKLVLPYANYIHIEITEDTLLVDEQRIKEAFKYFHSMGIPVHIDDFGTGYSSLSYLNKFDVDVIKVDRSFVLSLENEKGEKVFKSIMSIAKELEMGVVVEGVETDRQLNFIVEENDPVAIQGWYYSKSLPLDKFVEYVV
ncbi:EAL domain-containing protein [Vibrio hepatarius]|uniref:EAL domain-containing protein n=1 Tax=Vibrio hepatarius TaxID=171383 RepID=UPI00142D92BD|nr:PTS sugar transporter subunit IIC/EAL domain-containing protein [Vibrio hepatarius]